MQEITPKKLPSGELEHILSDHRRWLESEGTCGRKADLRCCDLSYRNLFGVDLSFLDDLSLDCSQNGVAGTLRVGGRMDDAILHDICMVWPSKANSLYQQCTYCQKR